MDSREKTIKQVLTYKCGNNKMVSTVEEKPVNFERHAFVVKYRYFHKPIQAFTLVEFLVVVAIISILMGILLPVLGKARQQAKTLIGMNNQKQIVYAVNFFAFDNNDRYPESSATMTEFGSNTWYWQEPTMMTACLNRPSMGHRSMSEYLHNYIADASLLFSPSVPGEYEYLQEAWDAGDDWDNPESTFPTDSVSGTYCFYWNYIGFLEEGERPFKGPRKSAESRRESKLLVRDYFGFGHWRNKKTYGSSEAYGSCEKFKGASATPEEATSSAYWSRLKSGSVSLKTIDVKPHAAYTDGHVESYLASEVVMMKVIKDRATNEPYDYGPGIFYLPRNGVR